MFVNSHCDIVTQLPGYDHCSTDYAKRQSQNLCLCVCLFVCWLVGLFCFKQRLAFAGCSSKCNFGQALLQVSKSEFKSWRSATAKALGCNRPGENAKIALALTGDDCDPQFLDLLQRCCFWRRFLWKFTVFQEEFLRLLNKGGLANRPAGSLARSALLLGWTVEGPALIHPWFGSLDWLRCTGKFLHFALSQTWMRTVCAELTYRK